MQKLPVSSIKNQWFFLTVLGFAAVTLVLFLRLPTIIGLPATVIFLSGLSLGIGSLLPKTVLFRPFLGFVAILGLLATGGGLMVNFYHASRFLVWLLLGVLTSSVYIFTKEPIWPRKKDWQKLISKLLNQAAPLLGIFFVLIFILFESRTGQRIFSAWDMLPSSYWLVYGLMIFLIVRSILNRPANALTSLTGIILASVAVHITLSAIYDTAYGTDIWRHLAMEKYLAGENKLGLTTVSDVLRFQEAKNANGGFWALLTILHWMSGLSLEIIHFWFTPILTAFAFPLLFFLIGWRLFKEELPALLIAFTSLLSFQLNVYGMIINPQSLGLIFLLQSLFFSLDSTFFRWPAKLLYGLTITGSIFTYPVTAIFSLAVAAFSFLAHQRHRLLRVTAFGALLLPSLFILLDLRAGYKFARWLENGNIADLLYQSNIIFVLAPSITIAILFWIVTTIGINALLLSKRVEGPVSKMIVLFFFSALILAVLSDGFTRQPLFLARTYQSLHLFLVPIYGAGIAALYLLFHRLRLRLVLSIITIGLAVLAVLIYRSPIRAISISGAEREAVAWIRENASSQLYAVLTDETTAAAGAGILGFNGQEYPYYWYPGGFLSRQSWEFGKNPRLETIERVRSELNLDIVYIIVTPIEPFGNNSLTEIQLLLGDPFFKKDDVAVFRYPAK